MKKNEPTVIIIILNYNGAPDTIDCLQSLLKISYPKYRVIIIDNDSSDDSFETIEQFLRFKSIDHLVSGHPEADKNMTDKLPFVTLIRNDKNGGYGYGNNVGIQYALENNADYVLILNNDTIVSPDFLEPLVQMCEDDDRIGIVTGKIYFHDRSDIIWFNGGKFNPYTAKVEHIHFNEKDVGQKAPGENTFISGCMWLIPRKVVENVGCLNEEYFMYVEDLEYCQRILNQGYTLKVCENSKLWHKVGSSSGGNFSKFSVFWMARNKVIFISTHVPKIYKFIAFLYLIVGNSIRWIKTNNFILLKTHIKGIIDGIKYVKL